MGAQMGGGNENTGNFENSKAGTKPDLAPPDNNFLMITLQQTQQLDPQEQQQQQDPNAQNKQKQKLRPIPQPDKQFLQRVFKLLNDKLEEEKAANGGINKLLASCLPVNNARGDFQGYLKFTGPDRKKLAKKFIDMYREERDRELKEEEKLEKKERKTDKSKRKLEISGEGVEGMHEAVEIQGAMSGDVASMGMVAGMAAMTKLSEGGGGSKDDKKSGKSPFALPSTRDKPSPFDSKD